jgi:hypothetical protein
MKVINGQKLGNLTKSKENVIGWDYNFDQVLVKEK